MFVFFFFFSIVPRMIFHLFPLFFLVFCFAFFPFLVVFHLLGALFVSVNSSFISGKSFAPSSFHSFMVDYSLVKQDCPSISFFFARLCGLLEFVGRQRPRVRLFVWRDCPYRFVLLFLFPLVHCLVEIALTLIMSGKKFRSSELEMGLSLFENRGVFEVSSSSTPHKAWSICCGLKEKDKKRIKNRFQFPSSVEVRIPDDDDKPCHSYADKVCFYEVDFVSGLRFTVHPFIRELFFHLLLALA